MRTLLLTICLSISTTSVFAMGQMDDTVCEHMSESNTRSNPKQEINQEVSEAPTQTNSAIGY